MMEEIRDEVVAAVEEILTEVGGPFLSEWEEEAVMTEEL